MNKPRKYEILIIEENLKSLIDRVEAVKELEDEAKSNMEEYPQFESKVSDSEMAIDSMEQAIELMEQAIETLTESRTI